MKTKIQQRQSKDKRTHPIRIVITNADPIFRKELRLLLESEQDMKIVGEACDGFEAVKLATEIKPDILLLDLTMPHMGLKALRDLSTRAVGVRIIPVTGGAYWVRRYSVSNLVPYLRNIMLLRNLMQSTNEETKQKKFGLTPRELQIVSWVVAGYSDREIAEYLKVMEDTVTFYLSQICDKFRVSTRLELALFAVNRGLPLKAIVKAGEEKDT